MSECKDCENPQWCGERHVCAFDRRKDNWTLILEKESKRIGRIFKDEKGRRFRYFGVVNGYDDLYYGMYSEKHGMRLLSCVGSIEGFGLKEIPLSQSMWDCERERYDQRKRERHSAARDERKDG